MEICIIGGGNMGYAFARALLSERVITPPHLTIVEKVLARADWLRNDLGCKVSTEVGESIRSSSTLILAVKPQDFSTTAAELISYLKPETVILSVLAGVKLNRLSKELNGHSRIVRSMPNLGAELQLSMTVFVSSAALNQEEHALARRIFDSAGLSLEVTEEALIDAATAVSATGPGLVFYFLEQMLLAATELGFTKEQGKLLLTQSYRAAIELWAKSDLSPEAWRAKVTSKAGTTEAAMNVFEAGKVGESIRKGVVQACIRSRELSK